MTPTPNTASPSGEREGGANPSEIPDAKILALLAIASAAREWATERIPDDYSERALLVALFDAFPGDFPGRENCGCDQSEMECDECPSIHRIRANIEQWRAEATALAREPAHGAL